MEKRKLCAIACALLMTASLSGCAGYAESFYDNVLSDVASSATSESNEQKETVAKELNRLEIDTAAIQISATENKLSQKAKVEIQTGKFNQAQSKLSRMVIDASGYIEKMKLSAGDFNSEKERTCDYIIRVPQQRYNSFMEELNLIGHIKSQTEETENLHESYYDTEARLDALKEKRDRLKELISTVESVDELLIIESELNDAEYKIDSMESAMKNYDEREAFATIELSLKEMYEMDQGEELSFGYRISTGFSECFHNALSFIQDMLVVASKNILAVLLMGGLLGAFVYSKVKQVKKENKTDTKEQKEIEPPEEENDVNVQLEHSAEGGPHE